MRKLLLTLFLLISFGTLYAQVLSPRQLFPGLFEAVQLSDIFPDNKTFVDATPLRDPALIMQDYNDQKDKTGFDLKQFVLNNFSIPTANNNIFKTDVSLGGRKHIET